MKTEVPSTPAKLRSSCSFDQHRTLVLNADYQPLGYPLEPLCAEDIIHGMVLERYTVVEWSDTYAHSPNFEMRLPSVVALKAYIREASLYGTPNCNLDNLYVRDHGICQYTGNALRMKSPNKDCEATMDHYIPYAKGGTTEWDNVVLASSTANGHKGDKYAFQAGFHLKVKPWVPKGAELLYLWLTEERLSNMPSSWHEFLGSIQPSTQVLRVLELQAKAA